jgi:hypothetical protein
MFPLQVIVGEEVKEGERKDVLINQYALAVYTFPCYVFYAQLCSSILFSKIM